MYFLGENIWTKVMPGYACTLFYNRNELCGERMVSSKPAKHGRLLTADKSAKC